MLYDQSQLIALYCESYQLTDDTFYRDIACSIGDYVLREMQSPGGGFYSAQDADSLPPVHKRAPGSTVRVLQETCQGYHHCYESDRHREIDALCCMHFCGLRRKKLKVHTMCGKKRRSASC